MTIEDYLREAVLRDWRRVLSTTYQSFERLAPAKEDKDD